MTDQSGVETPTTPQDSVDVSARKVTHVSPSDESMKHRGGRASEERSFTHDEIKADTAEKEEEREEVMPVADEGSGEDPAEQPGQSESHGYHDKDGAVYFDQGPESRELRLPPGVPVPSQDMINRHKSWTLSLSAVVRALRVRSSECASAHRLRRSCK